MCGLMMRGPNVTPTVSPVRIAWMEAVLRTLREAGFSANLTHHAYHALDSHITGFTLWIVSMPFETHDELVDLAQAFLPQIPAEQYPYPWSTRTSTWCRPTPTRRASSSSGSI